ncbi:MAG: HAMP domain-containing sensor histidine kinase [Myxococcota bacterium]
MASKRRRTRSISGPIILSSVAVALTAALLVGWIYVLVRSPYVIPAANMWLLVVGIVSFVAIMTVLVLFSVFLAREILEVRRQTSFIDSVTHELRSPLASLRLCLDTMERRELPKEKVEHLRSMMAGDVERLIAFVEDILEASRLEQGAGGSDVSDIDLLELAQGCALQAARRHDADPSVITMEIPRELRLWTDRPALEVVLRNLIDNAVKYSDAPIRVTVSAKVLAKGAVCIEVVDKGVGIPRWALGRVFERVYRVEDEKIRERRGTGLGLFVVSALVRRMRGKLRAFSDGPGEGTTMQVVLRRAVRQELPHSVSTSTEQPAG